MAAKLSLRFAAFAYLAAILALPVGMIFYRSFEHGLFAAWQAVTQPLQPVPVSPRRDPW